MPKLTNRTPAEVPPATKLQMQDFFTKVLDSLDRIIEEPESNSAIEKEVPDERIMMSLEEPDDLSIVFESASFSTDSWEDTDNERTTDFSESFIPFPPSDMLKKSIRKNQVNDLLSRVEEPQTFYQVVLKTSFEKHSPPKDLQEFLRNLTTR